MVADKNSTTCEPSEGLGATVLEPPLAYQRTALGQH